MTRIIIESPSGGGELEVEQSVFDAGFFPDYVYVRDAGPSGSTEPAVFDQRVASLIPSGSGSATEAALRAAFVTEANLSSEVATQLAADPTPAQAAADAVSSEIASRSLVQTTDPGVARQVPGGLALERLVDSNRRSIRYVSADGVHHFPAGTETKYAGTTFTGSNGYLKGTRDANGRRLEDALDESGRVPDWVLANWGSRAGPLLGVTPYKKVAGFGDSMSDDYSSLPGYISYLSALLGGAQVHKDGVSAQTSTEVALRQGGLRAHIAFTGNSIPADTASYAVTNDVTGDWRSGFSWDFPGTIAGVHGTLHWDGAGNWTWTRTTAGSAVTVPVAGSLFVSDEAAPYASWIQILWAGRNNVDTAVVLRDMRAMVEYLAPAKKRFLVVSVCNTSSEPSGSSGYNAVMALNQALSDQFGPNYVDLRAHAIKYGLAEAGITATASDTSAIAADQIPPSLLLDGEHFTTAGRQYVVAPFFANIIKERGWI